ncbi:MAG TPA: 50S ribosomal protein L11 methyltransferase [Acidobacteriota bacterium]|nr:50S ribosomal protein L11 methyltransferase [Acidobacteriota bacterium]
MDEAKTVWTVARIRTRANRSDAVIEILWEAGTLGVEERGLDDRQMVAYFSADIQPQQLHQQLQTLLRQRGVEPASLETDRCEIDPAAWLHSYRESFQGFALGRRFHLHPSWETPSLRGRIPIQLDPGHAFGTGTHESTRLCIEALEDLLPGPAGMLDVGAGSGILSIAARKLAPALPVCALDYDWMAVEAARENFEINREQTIQLVCGSVDAVAGLFPLVVANLTAEILAVLGGRLRKISSEYLVISGLTSDQAPRIIELFAGATGFICRERRSLNGWECLQFARSARSASGGSG